MSDSEIPMTGQSLRANCRMMSETRQARINAACRGHAFRDASTTSPPPFTQFAARKYFGLPVW